MKNFNKKLRSRILSTLINGKIHLPHFISHFIVFLCGLALGIAIPSWHSKSISLNFQLNPSLNQTQTLPAPHKLLPLEMLLLNRTSNSTGWKNLFKPPTSVYHDMEEEELLWRASMVPNVGNSTLPRAKKVAFLFLTHGPLPLAPFWDLFFKGYEDLYSVYVHSNPLFKGTVPSNSVFYGRMIPRSKVVQWGTFSVVEAERLLLANALLDVSNQRFVLLSDSCIPLFNFSTIYNYLMSSSKSFLEVLDVPGLVGRDRYNPRMSPTIQFHQWRKGAQWFQIDRDLAHELISDLNYFSTFQRFCNGLCFGDEHYLPSFVTVRLWRKFSNRTLTWINWSMGGAHPFGFGEMETTRENLEWLRSYGNEGCEFNGGTNICFLFARKFLPSSLDSLMRIAPHVMQF
ncbi:hypothetical protein MANES_01G014300v8 [Manihot esculenta]|uniref:Uncharacterized protein n=2 Tax=Manihot esculenta TaxID=3983 RepID=A0A2C9WGV6_MANES|nr:hypothetical protein MANES_01G014300v8 [Manihot esculenta]